MADDQKSAASPLRLDKRRAFRQDGDRNIKRLYSRFFRLKSLFLNAFVLTLQSKEMQKCTSVFGLFSPLKAKNRAPKPDFAVFCPFLPKRQEETSLAMADKKVSLM
ncbi:MAG: hypothetical protein IK141_01760 [Clostridia bacterium]|nr:hypothetical protein [Clostridia bacterium]